MVSGLKNKQMKANEFRIGNFVSITYEAKKDVADTCHLDYPSELARGHFVISHFSTDEINVFIGKEIIEFSLSEIKPIPLTAEWLEKFGFNKFPNQKKYDMDNFWACGLRNGNEWHFEDLECIVKYVHQLQNLHFALMCEELTINEAAK